MIVRYLKRSSFQLLLLAATNVSLQVFFISLNFKVYGNQKIDDDYFLMSVLIVSQIIASISKFVWGYAVDNMSYKLVLIVSLALGGGFTVN